MPVYPYTCPAGHDFEVIRPYSRAADAAFCPEHEEPGVRIWTVPTSLVSREYVTDIMNGWTKGEGKPLAGHTMAETQHAALHMAKGQKSQQHQGSKVPNFTSFPGLPPTRNYTLD